MILSNIVNITMAAHNVDVILLFIYFFITARLRDVCDHFPQVDSTTQVSGSIPGLAP